MPWVITAYRRNPNPPPAKIPVRKWVEPAKPKPKKKKVTRTTSSNSRRATNSAALVAERRRRAAAEAKRRVAELARKNAARRAQQIATRQKNLARERLERLRKEQQAKVRESRKKAYNALHESASNALRRSSLVKDTVVRGPNMARRPNRVENTERQQAVAQAQKRIKEAEDKKRIRAAYEYQQKKRRALGEGPDPRTTKPRAPLLRKPVAVEAAVEKAKRARKFDPKLAEEILAEEAKRAARGNIDADTVGKLTEKYVKHAEKIGADYNKVADKLQAQIDRINAFIKAGNIASARRAYETYLKLVKTNGETFREYDRLFGGAGGKPGGGAVNEYFAQYAQIEKAQTEWWKRQMQAQLDADRSTVNARLKAAIRHGDKQAIKELSDLQRIYSGKTSLVYDPTTGKSRYRTVEEELDYREAQRILEMQKLREQFFNQQRGREIFARKRGLVRGLGGGFIRPDQRRVEEEIQRFTGGKLPPLKRAQDLQNFAGDLISSWEKREYAVRGLNGLQLGRGAPAANEKLYGQFLRDKKSFEKSVYSYFGSGVPEWWDRALAAPGVSHGLAFLNAIPSVFGVGARAGLGALTGSTQLDFGATPQDAPAHVKAEMAKLPPDGMAGMPRTNYFRKWLTTPEGQAWQAKRNADYKAKVDEQGRAFHKALGGDAGDVLDAINSFGAEPTSNAAVNLASQLLLDPTNAIPLKFTTYLARARFATSETALAAGKIGKTRTALRSFVADEGRIRMFEDFRKTALEVGGDPVKIRRAIDEIGLELANIRDRSALDKLIKSKLAAAGLDRTQVDDVLQFNQIERMIGLEIVSRGSNLKSQAAEAAKRIEEGDVAKKAAVAARRAGRKRREIEVKAGQEARQREANAARNRLARAQQVQVKRLTEAGKPRPATRLRVSHDPEPGKGLSNWVTEEQARRGIDGDRVFNDVDLQNPSVREAIKNDPTLTPDEVAYVLRTGSVKFPGDVNGGRALSDRPAERVRSLVASGDTQGAADEIGRYVARHLDGELDREGLDELRGVLGKVDPEIRAKIADELGEESLQAWSRIVKDAKISDAEQVRLARHAEMVRAVSGMTEEQWWTHLSTQALRVLRSKTSSRAAKDQARAAQADIRKARYAKAQAKRSRTYIDGEERARHASRVVSVEGQNVEELVAPRMIAPLAEDAKGLAVEQSRTLWRLLKSASDEVAPSNVRGITHNGKAVDHMPKDIFEQLDQAVADARFEVIGRRADTRTRSRRAPLGDSSDKLGKYSDKDPQIVAAKRRALREFEQKTGWKVSVAAYDEARRALWKGFVQNKSAQYLMDVAARAVKKNGGDFVETFKRLRAKEAKREARRQLYLMAYGEMFGHSPDDVIAEFTARYTDDGTLRKFEPRLTAFQRRTLEENVKTLSGVSDLSDEAAMGTWLRSRNAPPFDSREAGREFLIHTGAWSPRTADQISVGARSWSIDQEADYWRTSYGVVPAWADRSALGSDLNHIFHDQELYFEQMRQWGVFNKSMEWRLRLSGDSADEIEKVVLENKRELELQRRYVIERYGDLVSKDGERLDAMPWLMYPDEYKDYYRMRTLEGAGIADTLFQSEAEHARFLEQTQGLIDDLWDKYMKKAPGEDLEYADLFHFASEIQARILSDPTWSRRYRDVFGDALNAWADVNRAMVFMQGSFLVMNAIDVPIKTAWYRWTNRAIFNPQLIDEPAQAALQAAGVTLKELQERAAKMTPQDLGIDLTTTIYRYKQGQGVVPPASVRKGYRGVLENMTRGPRVLYRAAPHYAGKFEIMGKMNMARSMYPQVYADALRRLGNPELAEVAARRYIKKEITRLWPTAGDGAIEQLFNRFVPFSSYMVRNKVVFLSEAVSHPSILNKIEFIGAAIEKQNRENWEREHPGEPIDDSKVRQIELPWAPGYFLDLGQFSDATRGLKPLYKATGPQSALDVVSQWVRLVNPTAQAGLYMLTNALGVTQRIQWRPKYNEAGFLTGYERVVTGWTEPWSDEQPSLNLLWFVEAAQQIDLFSKGGLTNGEISQILGKILLFDAITPADRGQGLFELYKMLQGKDEDAAERWLRTTPDGKLLQDWLLSKQTELRDVADFFSLKQRFELDPKRWFHTQTAEFQKAVGDGYAQIKTIEASFEREMLEADTPEEQKRLKREMLLAITNVYRLHPEMTVFEVYSKTPSEWSRQLQRWQTNMKMDEFFALDAQRPQRADFKTSAAYAKAYDAWRHQKEIFLKTYPDVELTLAGGRADLMRMKQKIEKEWDAVFARIDKRKELIEAAKASGNDLLTDMLYLQQDLDYGRLRIDQQFLGWDESDFNTLPKGFIGPPTRREGALKGVTEFFDLDRRSYAKAVKEGRGQQWLDDRFYNNGLKEVINKAKGGTPFGEFDPAVFVAEMKKRPKLAAMYFEKNPGKKQKWAETESYIKYIGRWGRAVGVSDWDAAERIWSQLPEWVRQRYLNTHPNSKMTLSGARGGGGGGIQYNGQFFKSAESRDRFIRGSQYLGWVQRWVKYFDRGDSKGGMKFFWTMPKWVREQYFAKHPDKRAKYEAQLKYGAQLAEYFAADEAGKVAYLKSHPDLKKWLAKNVSGKEARRQAILAAYQALPKGDAWLKRVFREKYPEVFSKEAAGERKLRKVYDRLASHPEMLPEFEAWVKAIWASYTEMLKHVGARPRPLETDYEPVRRRRSLSAAETSR